MSDFDKDTYPTPDVIFGPLNAEFGFSVDGAASAENTKVPARFINAELDFMRFPLKNERVWVNPPYSKPLPFFNPAHRKMQQVIRHINVNDFGKLPWKKHS